MFTVTELARRCSLSRGTLLYYESIGLLKPPARTAGNYRAYGEKDLQRLTQVCIYRKAGLKLEEFEGPKYKRIDHIRRLLSSGALDERLRWKADFASHPETEAVSVLASGMDKRS